jgi:hypothetical protein
MGLDQDFLDLMPLTISVQHQAGVNEYNEPTWSSVVQYRARMETTRQYLRTAEGTEQIVSGRLIVDAQGTLHESDKVTLPDGKTPLVVAVATEYDETGIHHQVYELSG